MKKDGLKKISGFVLAFFFWSNILPGVGLAAPAIPGFYGAVTPQLAPPAVNALPVLRNVVQGASVPGASNNRLVINQNQSKAIINWESFNIGENASTHFDQQGNTDWAALNRIFDRDPSQIFGALTADGKIYLINQNGILFGPSSRVNVHALTASSLNIKDEDFLNGLLKFKTEDYNSQADNFADVNTSVVSNHGVIETDELGSVFLLSPTVENSGVIITPCGQIGLAAGTEVEITPATGYQKVEVKDAGDQGSASNFENGWLIADTGLAGMYGRVVNQEGLIRAVSAIKKGGKIELLASEKVSTGKNSLTISPVSESSETAHESFEYQGGEISIGGLDSDTPVKLIEHQGVICAPSGTVNLNAEERVYLENGSRIDVGGMWVDKSGEANLVEAQLNSVQLRDDYGQKDGLLQGETITANALAGSAIGDISGHLTSEEMTALERSTKGGTVNISASSGDIIVKEGAMIDFSGGGIRYGESNFQTTKLLAGDKIYDISEAPQWIQYDKIMGFQEKRHERYGITEEYAGLYYGGANPLNDYSPGYIAGSDAGQLTLIGKTIVLDGMLDGSVEPGIYQTEASEPEDEYSNQTVRGRKEPIGGALVIGDSNALTQIEGSRDFVVDEVVVKSEAAPLPEGFGADSELPSYLESSLCYEDQTPLHQTLLSAEKLNSAGLSNLEIYTNTRFKTEKDAGIALRACGGFSVTARSIEHQGEISVPAGMVDLTITDNKTSNIGCDDYVSMEQRIYLADGSSILTRGEKIDNSLTGAGAGETIMSGHINAGRVYIKDKTSFGDGVIVKQGALIDVSGGYEIDEKGNVSGGDAGTLELQGSTLAVEGDLRGHSLAGNEGGTIILHAENVEVLRSAPGLPGDFNFDSDIPDDLKDKLILAQNRLDQTGFTQIALRSVHDLTVEEDVNFSPSMVKLTTPGPGKLRGISHVKDYNAMQETRGSGGEDGFITVAPEYVGSSSVEMAAGEDREGVEADNIDAKLFVASGARIQAGPGGTIELKATEVELAGLLEARSGKVTLTATGTEGSRNLTLRTGSRILAAGYNKQRAEPLVKGLAAGYMPMSGGEVILEAEGGDLIIESGSLIDVSGSASTTSFIRNSDMTLSSVTVAGDPGSIELAYLNNMTLKGELNGHAGLDGVRGGSLAIGKRSEADGLTINADDIMRYQANGFDALTFGSWKELNFSGSMDMDIGRSLTLNAPEINGSSEDQIHLRASWLQLANTYWPDDGGEAAQGDAQITLSGDWIDVDGGVIMSGFKDVKLEASHDIRLSDRYYIRSGYSPVYEGGLETHGDLTLKAARIYPTTLSDFTIKSKGKVTTLPGGTLPVGPVFSAGGSLTIEANKIEHRGVLAAPMGEINLYGAGDDSRIYLAEGSLVSTAGEGRVKYGTLDEIFWTINDKENPSNADGIAVENAPEKSVDISIIDNPEGGGEIIVREGAEIDASGGGSLFSYKFLAGIEGSEDPLSKEGQYVILPDNSVVLPGEAVYLEGAEGIPAGTYSLLPEEYAFVPGAIVITDLGMDVVPGESMVTEEGYTVVSGYATVFGTNIRSPKPSGYAIRPAEDVLKEGGFNLSELTAGDAGSVTLNGPTTILDGTIKGDALPGYQGGFLSMSAAENAVVRSSVSLPTGFGFEDTLPGDLKGMCMVSSDGLAGRGVRELNIGDIGTTNTITLEDGSILDAPIVALSARDSITLESGAQILALGEGGTAGLISPDGEVIIEENALVHASNVVNLETSNFTLDGEMKVDNSTLNLQGDNIFIVPDDYAGTRVADTIYLTESLWGLTGFDNIGFISRNDLTFLGNIDLEVAEELTIDAKRIAGLDLDGGNTSNITSQTINLLNTTGDASIDAGLDDTCLVTFNADDMTVGHGDLLFDGFSAVNLNSDSDLTFKGKGSLISSGDLNMSAARVTTSCYQDTETSYEVADFQVDAGDSTININKSGGIAKDTKIPGGSLELLARTINHSGIVDVTAGRVKFIATGSGANEGIFLKNGSQIFARGSDYAPGGLVDLQTEEGALNIEAGSKIDVSAGGQGDAGAVSLYAPAEGVVIDGDIEGHSQGGRGGSFALDTKELDNFSSLNTELAAGGFNEEVNIRTRSGNVDIAADDTVMASQFKLTVDKTVTGDGDINLSGTIDASGDKGGTVELYAGNDLNLDGTINAHATGAGLPEGEVFLSAAAGTVDFKDGSFVDVSGGENGEGGKVSFLAMRDGNDVKMNLNGTIAGASRVIAEAVKVYSHTGDFEITNTYINNTLKTETEDFMDYAGTIETRLLAGLTLDDDNDFHLLPGIEIQSAGDLTLVSTWDMSPHSWGFPTGYWWRYGADDEPGVLTLRAAGNLDINYDLVDHPTTSYYDLQMSPELDSWGLNLAAGADLEGAGHLTVKRNLADNTGKLEIKDSKVVYTESAPIRFASGNDTVIGSGRQPMYMINNSSDMKYGLASYDGSVQGDAGRDLIIENAIQTAIGDINIKVGQNLDLGLKGAIRTTGYRELSQEELETGWLKYMVIGNYPEYAHGGSITLDVGNAVQSMNIESYWDKDGGYTIYRGKSGVWAANYTDSITSGLATMGGGDLDVRVGGDFYGKTGAFQTGDVRLYAGGDIDGRFLIKEGEGEIHGAGNFGALALLEMNSVENQAVEAFDAQMNVSAQGNIDLGTVVNPTIARQGFEGESLQYTEDTKVKLTAVTGDVTISGRSRHYDQISNTQYQQILPATFEIEAGGDINIKSDFVLAPSATGNFCLTAGEDINGSYMSGGKVFNSKIILSDLDPDEVYGDWGFQYWNTFNSGFEHAETLVHLNDPVPIEIKAGRDIKNLRLFLPEKAEIEACRDIRDIYYVGQNINPEDVTTIKAGRNIFFSTAASDYQTGIEYGGPGFLIVQAGNSIDLGTTKGIQSVGNFYNSALGSKGCSLIVISGSNKDIEPDQAVTFFDQLRDAGVDYSNLLAEGDAGSAFERIEEAREDIINPFFQGDPAGEGDIDMVRSQIMTAGSDSGIFVIARGDFNVGQSTFSAEAEKENTGVITESKGPINIFADGDVNVLESRVMTMMGGDITVWSDKGDINAGRGSTTAVNRGKPTRVWKEDHWEIQRKPVAVGSGIRTLTYDPDGFEGPLEPPDAGDAYLFAPEGIIDAGEAGISARNVILGATAVLNAQNIEVSGVSVGVPVASEGASGLGALAGAGSLAATSGLTEEMAGLDTGEDVAEGYSEPEDYTPTWLKVKVVGFDEEKDDDT